MMILEAEADNWRLLIADRFTEDQNETNNLQSAARCYSRYLKYQSRSTGGETHACYPSIKATGQINLVLPINLELNTGANQSTIEYNMV
ncbi:hypothetical protein M8J75_010509 [Diaphorina citri]|nr:hypothetical protein M8J75_010619 [Diaphorina citri]KAI5712695.1 hypothetical protein M8J75_010509 [Diaphorina citri]